MQPQTTTNPRQRTPSKAQPSISARTRSTKDSSEHDQSSPFVAVLVSPASASHEGLRPHAALRPEGVLRTTITFLKSIAGRVSCDRNSGICGISCIRNHRGGVATTTRNRLFRGTADGNDSLSGMSSGVEPGNVCLRKLDEAGHWTWGGVRIGHLA